MCRKPIYLILSILLLAAVLSSTASAEIVGWWKFDETEGTVAADSSGNGNDGDVLNGGTRISGPIDGALQLDGTDDYVELPIGSVIATLEECTFAVWVNFGGGGNWSRIFDFGTSQANYIYLCAADGDGALRLAIVAGNGVWNEIMYGDGLPTDEWHHVAATVSDSEATLRLYLDGQEVGSFTNAVNSVDDLGATSNNWLGHSQYAPADTDLNGALDDFQIHNVVLAPEDIERVMAGLTDASARPRPQDGAVDVRPDTALSWSPGQGAATHDVYLGMYLDDVNDASRADPRGVLVSQDQSDATYDPPGLLQLGQTYYWRVDDVNAASATSLKGSIWSFTVETYTYLVQDVNAVANVAAEAGSELVNIVNGSGLAEDGGHSIAASDMWKGLAQPGDTVTVDFEFGRVYKLDEMRVWNYNHQYEPFLGFSSKDVKVEYSADAQTWTTLGDYVLAQGNGRVTFQPQVIDFGGVAAKYVRFTITSNYNGQGYGLSEVQFFEIPTYAREPQPVAGAEDVSPSVTLSWRPGREAVSHEVHLSTDAGAVTAGEALVATVSTPSYDTTALDLLMGEKYYWLVNEVNEAATPSTWSSVVWDFNTPDFVVVDDFESYNDDDGTRVFDAWVDGFGIGDNGALVGNNQPPYAEEENVHSGAQAMPFAYGEEGATTSEAELTLNGVDWMRAAASTLVVWFRGSLGNATGQLYLEVNGTRVDYDGSAGSLAAPVWKQWNVDLASLGAAASNVRTLTLGVSASGRGTLYFDDIRLYRDAPPATSNAADPGTAALMAHYTMENTAADASGHGYDGTVAIGSSYEQGLAGYGRAVVLDGVSAYVDLPIGPLLQSLDSITVATWVNYTGTGSWARIFDFGTGTSVNMFLTPNSGVGTLRFAIATNATGGGAGESLVEAPSSLPGGWHHVAVTIDSATGAMNLYLDGSVVDSGTTDTLPSDLGNTTQNWIGRSQYTTDPYLTGSVDEFRIYNRALSTAEIQYLVGDR